MPANLKQVRGRIKSVMSTQQITKAMKMVSAAKFRRAQDAIIQMRPYAKKMNNILGNLAAALDGQMSLDLAESRKLKHILIVVLTSDRGLCGSFNTNINRKAENLAKEQYANQFENGQVTILTIGKKGNDYFAKWSGNVISDHVHLLHDLSYDAANKVSNFLTDSFLSGEFDRVDVVYSRFKNAASQVFQIEQFLPIIKVESDLSSKTKTDFIFEPDRDKLIAELLPLMLRTNFYRMLLDTVASEHGARMTAMDQATENANELLRDLRLTYNRARQDAITTELIEIVSGAAALNA